MLISSSLVFCLPAQSKNSCTKNDQCDTSNECCLFSILSFFPIYEISSVGTCTRFLEEEADCTFWGLGTCGCRPGLECVDRPFIFPNFNFTFPLVSSIIKKNKKILF